MALDTNRLANLIMDEMESRGLAPRNPKADGKAIALYTSIAAAVVQEIQANAEVTTVVGGGSSAGSHPGTIS